MELGVGFTDADGDGYVSWVNGGLDDDSNPDIFPSQTERKISLMMTVMVGSMTN